MPGDSLVDECSFHGNCWLWSILKWLLNGSLGFSMPIYIWRGMLDDSFVDECSIHWTSWHALPTYQIMSWMFHHPTCSFSKGNFEQVAMKLSFSQKWKCCWYFEVFVQQCPANRRLHGSGNPVSVLGRGSWLNRRCPGCPWRCLPPHAPFT